jgi:hypothetical protein
MYPFIYDIPEVNRLVSQIAEKAVGVYVCICIDTYQYICIYKYVKIYHIFIFTYI